MTSGTVGLTGVLWHGEGATWVVVVVVVVVHSIRC